MGHAPDHVCGWWLYIARKLKLILLQMQETSWKVSKRIRHKHTHLSKQRSADEKQDLQT
jgi:hypothetical protein